MISIRTRVLQHAIINTFLCSLIMYNFRHEIHPTINALYDISSIFLDRTPHQVNEEPFPSFVAHAGGMVKGHIYTNSLEALNENYIKGYRLFELDLMTTSDGKIILSHGWDTKKPFADFLKDPMIYGLHPLDWNSFEVWFRSHGDTTIITDVKSDNIAVLAEIARSKDLQHRIIPQIYEFNQYAKVYEMGYKRIFLTLYRNDYPNWTLFLFTKTHTLGAVVCMPFRIYNNDLLRLLKKVGIPLYVHTVNSIDEYHNLKKMGVYGIYTDSILE